MSALAERALRDAAPMGFIESLDDIGHATARRLAHAAADALHAELSLYPKPGLVSFVDNGSHADMTAATFLCSIDALHGYFKAISALGAQRSQAAPFAALEQLGIAAERHMLRATGGVNTHRGAIFVIGMLCAAAGAAGAGDRHVSADGLRRRLLADWGTDLHARVALDAPSHGQRAALGHRLRGARAEAAAGFPVLFEHAVPALREALAAGLDDRRAHLQTFFVAMSELDDTNLVHRAGVDGLRHAKQSARAFLATGGACAADATSRAEQIHRDFVQRRLSPGGAADILAASIWTVRVCGVSLALLFPGQGTQHPTMLHWLDDEPASVCEPLVAAFGRHWRARLADVAWSQRNVVAQPLITGIGVAAWRALGSRLPKPAVIAGYSVGELAAFHAAGVIGTADAMALARRRAELMDECTAGVDTGLMSVANAPAAPVALLCTRHRLAVAVRLAPDHVIVGGSRSALDAAEEEATDAGMKATPLAVATASHTPWMAGAVGPFATLLGSVAFERPRTPLVCDHEAGVRSQPASLRHALAAQLAETVRWDACMTAVEERGVRCVLEMGPGSALSRLWNARPTAVPARSIDEFRTVEAITRWVADALA